MVEKDEPGRNVTRSRQKTPIVVPVFHREEDTKLMFKQLSKVTDNYSVIIVNNGFDDREFLDSLQPLHYIENKENTGAIRPINQGLEVADGEYVAVLHNDLLIFDEGWLDHIIEFMERRRDVGLVGLGGRHTINADGMYDNDTTVAGNRDLPFSYKPTWRLTEVATIDGLGWVMRNIGLRLDESFGLMHFYDLDLSLQFIDAGYRVYVAMVDIRHLADDNERSTRSRSDYLDRIGGDDSSYFDEVQEKFRKKWQHMLPITRGFKDESSAYQRIAELYEWLDGLQDHINELGPYVRQLEAEDKKKSAVIEEGARYVRMLENEDSKRLAENERLSKHVSELEKRLSAEGVSAERKADHPERSDSTRRSAVAKFRLYTESEGLAKTLKRTALYVPRKAGLLRRENSQENRH
jgi:glycosyltransferase involved in cell wall biosynthesis